MGKSALIYLLAVILTCTAGVLARQEAWADELAVSHFAAEGIDGWKSKSFKGSTQYTVVKIEDRSVLKAEAVAAASGLTRAIPFDPHVYRYLKWSWKITGTVPGGDARTKQGDDYAARIYVVFPGRFFWQTRALNYIWANKLPAGEFVPNAFTANAMLLAVESGSAKAGQWISEKRDLLNDFRRVFGEDPPEAGGIAIMTDSDNTGAKASAWYGDIVISTTP